MYTVFAETPKKNNDQRRK